MLAQKGFQLQTQVLYYLDERLDISEPTIVVLPDTPWCLMFRIEGVLWDLELGDLLSVGIGIWSKQGICHVKTATECTREEIAEEVWMQLKMCNGMMRGIKFRYLNTKSLDDIEIPKWDIWYSYEFDKNINKMKTWEPKFSNNVDTLNLRPEINDFDIINLKHATAYAKTDTNIFCMESAAEAGNKAAESIVKNTNNSKHKSFSKEDDYISRDVSHVKLSGQHSDNIFSSSTGGTKFSHKKYTNNIFWNLIRIIDDLIY